MTGGLAAAGVAAGGAMTGPHKRPNAASQPQESQQAAP